MVGGGPAGATAAALLARAGLRVVCFERERFPRFHVGESLLPANVPLFDRLGVLPEIEAAGFLAKRGAAFFDAEGRQRLVNFRRGPGWADHAFNVPRADFDRLLLDHAGKAGAAIFQGTEVVHVDPGPAGVRLEIQTADGGTRAAEAAYLVDASGRDALLASRLGRRTPMPDLGKVALYAHYRGADRWTGRTEGHLRVFLFEHGWFWWIPFSGDVTSIGCILHQRAVKDRQGSIESLLDEMIAACPPVAAGTRAATRLGGVWSAANFAYRTDPVAGDRFLAIGDAVTFVDPIFSTGVYIAMQSAELAARTIVAQFRDGDFRAGRFDATRRRLERGTSLFFALIRRYYEPAFMDVFFDPAPPVIGPAVRDAFTTVLAGGAFLRRSLWIQACLGVMFLAAAHRRRQRRRQGLSTESRLAW